MKYLIVGGVAGGATTAARLRRLDEKCEIVIFVTHDVDEALLLSNEIVVLSRPPVQIVA